MRAAALPLLLVSLAAAGAASAQVSDAPRPKRRPIPAAPAPVAAPAPARSTPVPLPGGRLTLGGLSGLRTPDDHGASCRSACARTRYACEVQDDACAGPWTACLKSCSDAQVPPLTALLPR